MVAGCGAAVLGGAVAVVRIVIWTDDGSSGSRDAEYTTAGATAPRGGYCQHLFLNLNEPE